MESRREHEDDESPEGVVASVRERARRAARAAAVFIGRHPGVLLAASLALAAVSSAVADHDGIGDGEGGAETRGETEPEPSPEPPKDFPYWDEARGCYVKNGERRAYVTTHTDLRSGRTRAVWDYDGDNAYDEYERVSGRGWAKDVSYERLPEHELEEVLCGIDQGDLVFEMVPEDEG